MQIGFDPLYGVPIPHWVTLLLAVLLGICAVLALRARNQAFAHFKTWLVGMIGTGVLLSGALGVNLVQEARASTHAQDLVTSPAIFTLSPDDMWFLIGSGGGIRFTATNKTGIPIIIRERSISSSLYHTPAPNDCSVSTVLAPEESCHVDVGYNGAHWD